jgi:hypothetical protein
VALVPDRGAAGAAAALSLGHLAILAGVAATAHRYRDAAPRGPRAFDDSGLAAPQ